MQSVDTAVTDVALATKKFFKRVLPIMLVMLVCNQLNRSNIGYAQEQLRSGRRDRCRRLRLWRRAVLHRLRHL